MHQNNQPVEWVKRFAGIVPEYGPVLDLACGGGRHGRFLMELGHPVTFVDRNVTGLGDIAGLGEAVIVETDLETGSPWPQQLVQTKFAGIVVVNYLHRPHFPMIVESLTAGGVLIYQTFAQGNEKYGRPSNPDFLLRENELMEYFGKDLDVVEFEQGFFQEPKPAVIQKICACKNY